MRFFSGIDFDPLCTNKLQMRNPQTMEDFNPSKVCLGPSVAPEDFSKCACNCYYFQQPNLVIGGGDGFYCTMMRNACQGGRIHLNYTEPVCVQGVPATAIPPSYYRKQCVPLRIGDEGGGILNVSHSCAWARDESDQEPPAKIKSWVLTVDRLPLHQYTQPAEGWEWSAMLTISINFDQGLASGNWALFAQYQSNSVNNWRNKGGTLALIPDSVHILFPHDHFDPMCPGIRSNIPGSVTLVREDCFPDEFSKDCSPGL